MVDDAKKEKRGEFDEMLVKIAEIHTAILKNNGDCGHLFGKELSFADMSTYAFYKLFVMYAVEFDATVGSVVKDKITPEILNLIRTVEANPMLDGHVSKKGRLVEHILANTNMASYTFRYFPVIGYGETSRLLLTAAKVDSDGGPDVVLSESGTIERYLARTYGFLPVDPSQAALQEQIRDRQVDTLLAFSNSMFVKESAKEEVYAKFEYLLDMFNSTQTELLRKNGDTGRSFGTTLSYADIATYAFMKLFLIHCVQFSEVVPKLFKAKLTPELVKLAATVEADPLLAAYVEAKGSIAALV
ncbi:hypothetical protein GGI21_004384 [Coemansia aciculifera]|nr:hypothetical protein GGI21_004384 [Coemansia aciculifera]